MDNNFLEKSLVIAINELIGKKNFYTEDEIKKFKKNELAHNKSIDSSLIFKKFYNYISLVDNEEKPEVAVPAADDDIVALKTTPLLQEQENKTQISCGVQCSKDELKAPESNFKIYIIDWLNLNSYGGNRIFVVLEVEPTTTIAELKVKIQEKTGYYPVYYLAFGEKRLEQCQKSLADYNIKERSILYMDDYRYGGVGLWPSREPQKVYTTVIPGYRVKMDEFDDKFNFDFRKIKIDSKIYYRNKFIYNRPFGSIRFAIKVVGKYPDDDWLGANGDRTETDEKEWPVAYHGTQGENALPIIKEGFDLEKGTRFAYGRGIYCTPNPKAALDYAREFSDDNGKHFRLILQTRVNPETLTVVRTKHTTDPNHAEYWIVPNQKSIRPYGVCVYQNGAADSCVLQ